VVANIHGGVPVIAARMMAETRQKESLKAASDGMADPSGVDNTDDGTPAALQQKLADMADDMASVATQFRNRRDLEKKGAASGENFERVLEEDAGPKAQKLVEVLAVQHLSLDVLLAQARGLFPDDSDLFLVLRELLKRKQLGRIQRSRLEQLLDKVTRDADPKMLRGGINCALKARLFGAALGLQASLLRQSYRRFLESNGRPLDDYEDWISSYGYKARHPVLDFLEESLASDIRAEDPSCGHLEFSYLLGNMRKLHLLRTADREFISSLLTRKLTPPRDEEEADWLLLLCTLLGRQVPAEQVLRQALGASLLTTHADRSAWIGAVRGACKRLPPELFAQPGETTEDARAVTADMLDAFDRLTDHSYAAELLEQRRIPT